MVILMCVGAGLFLLARVILCIFSLLGSLKSLFRVFNLWTVPMGLRKLVTRTLLLEQMYLCEGS